MKCSIIHNVTKIDIKFTRIRKKSCSDAQVTLPPPVAKVSVILLQAARYEGLVGVGSYFRRICSNAMSTSDLRRSARSDTARKHNQVHAWWQKRWLFHIV